MTNTFRPLAEAPIPEAALDRFLDQKETPTLNRAAPPQRANDPDEISANSGDLDQDAKDPQEDTKPQGPKADIEEWRGARGSARRLDAQGRPDKRRLNLDLPAYVLDELEQEVRDRRERDRSVITTRWIILKALKRAGYYIDDNDLYGDTRHVKYDAGGNATGTPPKGFSLGGPDDPVKKAKPKKKI